MAHDRASSECQANETITELLLEATRSLLWISTPEDGQRVAADFVRAVGGMIVLARTADSDALLSRTKEDLAFIVQYVGAAKLVDDPDVLTDFLDWLATLLHARHVPTDALIASLEVLRPAIAEVDHEAGRLADLGLRYLALGT